MKIQVEFSWIQSITVSCLINKMRMISKEAKEDVIEINEKGSFDSRDL